MNNPDRKETPEMVRRAEAIAWEKFGEMFGKDATMRIGGARFHWWCNVRDKALREMAR